jgi:hypothetical protein
MADAAILAKVSARRIRDGFPNEISRCRQCSTLNRPLAKTFGNKNLTFINTGLHFISKKPFTLSASEPIRQYDVC